MIRTAKRLLGEQKATSATEYAIMVALIVLVAVGAISGLGAKVGEAFTTLTANLG